MGYYAHNCKGRKKSSNRKLLESTTNRTRRNLLRSRKGPTIQLSRSGVLYTSLRRVMTRTGTSREHLARRDGNAHVASSAAVLSVSSPPGNDHEQPSLDVDNDFYKGFAFPRLLTGNVERSFHPTPVGSC